MNYIWIVWDILALLILALMIGMAAQKGFLRTVVGFFGLAISAVAAGFLSTPLAQFLYSAVVRDAIRAVISRQIAEAFQEGTAEVGSWVGRLPGWAAGMIPPGAEVEAPKAITDIAPVVERFIDSILAQPVLSLLRGLCFLVLFSVFAVVVRYFARMLRLVDRIPLIGSINTMLGGVLGVGEALVALYLLAVLAHVYLTFSGGGGQYLNEPTLSQGFLFGFFFRLAS